MHNKVIIIDTETTGLHPWRNQQPHHEIIEIAMLVINSQQDMQCLLHKKYHMRRPKQADPVALKINRYDKEKWDILGTEMTPSAVQEIYDMLNKKDIVLVGHNVSFDVRFLRTLFTEHNLRWYAPPQIDTRALARMVWGLESLSMDTIREHNGWSAAESHTAMKDAIDSWRIYAEFINRLQNNPVRKVYEEGTSEVQ